MRRLFVEIEDSTFEVIATDASVNRRPPRDHAGWILDEWARRLGKESVLGQPLRFIVAEEAV